MDVPAVTAPACVNECGRFMRRSLAEQGADANVSHLPPVVASAYPPLVMTCPHGVTWFAEPSNEQRAKWAEDGVA